MNPSPPDVIDFGVPSLPSASVEGDLNIASFVLEVRNRLTCLESAHHTEISRLKAALAESESARKALESQISRLSAPPASSSSAAPPPPQQSAKAVSFASVVAASPGSSLARSSASSVSVTATTTSGSKKRKKSAAPPPSIKKATATVSRLFGPQTDIPSGYQFVYMSIARRRPLQEIRRTLQGIKINHSRVLDISTLSPMLSFLSYTTIMYILSPVQCIKKVVAPLLSLILIPVTPKMSWIQKV